MFLTPNNKMVLSHKLKTRMKIRIQKLHRSLGVLHNPTNKFPQNLNLALSRQEPIQPPLATPSTGQQLQLSIYAKL